MLSTSSAWILMLGCLGGGPSDPDNLGHDEQVKTLMRTGCFAEARKSALTAVESAPENGELLLLLAELELLHWRAQEAERWLERLAGDPALATRVAPLLAESLYRQDRFAEAAVHLRRSGQLAAAEKLESFGEETPYRRLGEAGRTRIPFECTDPLPLLPLVVNGVEGTFLLDTGGGELILDPDFAAEADVETFGGVLGEFAGGRTREIVHARVEVVELGEFEIEQVPAQVLPTSAFSAVFGGRPVHGVLGTIVLYHFLSTIDYPGQALELRRRTPENHTVLQEEMRAAGAQRVPVWLAGDHLILVRGTVADAVDEELLLVDTGLAGGAFTGPDSTLKAAGIQLEGDGIEGIGGGGRVRVIPFTLSRLSIGEAVRTDLPAFHGAFPPNLEHAHGFRIGGLISHAFFRPFAVTLDPIEGVLYLR